ncbi:MAG TPA: heme-binding protein, partial [Methylibium sp.]
VVDEAGELVALQRMDKVQRASIDIAVGKARAAMLFLRPSAALEEAAKARTNLLSVASDVPRVVFVQGGLPLIVGKDQVGAIGVSGLTSPQDEQVAKAGVDAIK